MQYMVSLGNGVFSLGRNVLVTLKLSTYILPSLLLAQVALAAPADDFVTTWKTNNPGTSGSTSITVPMTGGPYDVDWDNDGVFDESVITGPVTHDFGVAGTYTIRVYGFYESIRFANGGDKEKILSVEQWGTGSWNSMEQAFHGAVNLLIPAPDTPDFSAVTDMSQMFYDAISANPDTSGWDPSAVTDMYAMFWNAALADPDTSGWNTSLVKNMSGMFKGAISADADTSGWDTSAVEDMSNMFFDATSANPDTSSWDTSAVMNMFGMFQDATSANPDTSAWDVSSVVQMGYMFYNATSANPDTSGWDTSAVRFMKNMFYNATSANPDTSAWNTSMVTDMYGMFYNATSANPDTSGWDTSAVELMGFMFFNALSANPDTSGWDTSLVTSMEAMFQGAVAADPDTSGWNTSAVEDIYSMFQGAISANPDTSGWDTSSILDMSYMFQDAISFDRDIGSWDVTTLEDATDMFAGVTLSPINYESLLTGWNDQALNSYVGFSGGHSIYCSDEAAAARANMIASDFWFITDGGRVCLPPSPNLAPDLTPESDTGISDSDNFTADNTPDFYVECLTIGDTVTLYSDNPAANTVLGSHLCATAGVETAAVTNALIDGVHQVTYTYTNPAGESGHSPSLAVTVSREDLIFSDGFEDAP